MKPPLQSPILPGHSSTSPCRYHNLTPHHLLAIDLRSVISMIKSASVLVLPMTVEQKEKEGEAYRSTCYRMDQHHEAALCCPPCGIKVVQICQWGTEKSSTVPHALRVSVQNYTVLGWAGLSEWIRAVSTSSCTKRTTNKPTTPVLLQDQRHIWMAVWKPFLYSFVQVSGQLVLQRA